MKKFLPLILAASLASNANANDNTNFTENNYKFKLSADKNFTHQTGADISITSMEAWTLLGDKLVTSDNKAVGVLRSVTDILATLTISIMNHEVFGHGARAREFGLEITEYNWGPLGGYAAFNSKDYNKLKPYQKSLFALGGMEASTILANNYQHNILENQKFSSAHSFAYLFANHDQTLYTSGTKISDDGDDVASYMKEVNKAYGQEIISRKKLKSSMYLNLADPFTFGAAYSFFKGEDVDLFMFDIAGVKYLPGLRSIYAPYGLETKFINYIKYEDMIAEIGFIYGDNKTGKSSAIDAKVKNIYKIDNIGFGARIAAWNQPKLLEKEYAKGANIKSQKTGYLGALNISYKINESSEFSIEGGYKTDGYLVGEPAKATPLVRASISINL